MSIPQTPKPAKLIIGILAKEKKIVVPVASALSSQFGEIDLVSAWMKFNYSRYYEPEMGFPLVRRMFAFKQLIEQSELASIKNATNQIEKTYSSDGKRGANIDPGYLLHERFVLASGKNFSHRIYIGLGIYADLTLIYQKGSFQRLAWTYPDYSDQPVLTFLEQVRSKYVIDVRQDA